MAITYLKRDQNDQSNIVRMVSTNTIAEVGTAGYLATQLDEILELNKGAFTWQTTDMVLCYCSDGWGFYTISADFEDLNAFVFIPGVTGATVVGNLAAFDSTQGNLVDSGFAAANLLSSALASGRVYVGSAGGVATGVVMSGDATMVASGALTLASTLQKYAAVAVSAAEFNGMYAAPKLLVAAGGANTLLVIDKVQLAMTYNAAAYAAGGVAAVQYDSTVNGAGVIASTTLAAATFQAAASTTFSFNPGVVALPFATTVNKGLYLSNITGAFTTGNSAMVAHVWYKVIPTV